MRDTPAASASDEAAPRGGMIAALEVIAAEAPAAGLTLHELTHALGERAFGLLLFVLALPVCVPVLYGIPQIVSLPMTAIAVQMALGQDEPWMPRRFGERRLGKSALAHMAVGARRWFGWIERLARPRLLLLSGPTAERVVGAIFLVFIASILIPFPASNFMPGIGIVMASVGLITRDGLLVLAGLVIGLGWITLLLVGVAFFGAAFVDLFQDFLKALFGLG